MDIKKERKMWKMPGDKGYFEPAKPKEKLCLVESNDRLLICTRTRGHEGNHAAHGYSTSAQFRDWPNDAQKDNAKENAAN